MTADTTTGGNVRVALDFRARAAAMLDDPDLAGDALLFALAVVDVIFERKENRRRPAEKTNWLAAISERTGLSDYQIRRVIADDIPRYEPPGGSDRRCTAPMIRREGPCGKSTIIAWMDRDPASGEATWVGLCTRHRTHEIEWEHGQRIKEWRANGSPEPPANTGGALRRYFHCNWDELYQWADHYRWERAKGKDAPPPSTPRPRLTVIQGGAS